MLEPILLCYDLRLFSDYDVFVLSNRAKFADWSDELGYVTHILGAEIFCLRVTINTKVVVAFDTVAIDARDRKVGNFFSLSGIYLVLMIYSLTNLRPDNTEDNVV